MLYEVGVSNRIKKLSQLPGPGAMQAGVMSTRTFGAMPLNP